MNYLCCEECNAEYINEEIAKLEILSDSETVTVYICDVCANKIFEYNSFELSNSLYNHSTTTYLYIGIGLIIK